MNIQKIRILIIAICAILATGFLASLYVGKNEQGTSVVRSSGKALIGGAFSLTDHTGKTVTHETYKGKYKLVMFGFTNCPDFCPAELQIITAALDGIGDKTDKVKSLFVTIDPARDTQENLAKYMSHFHKNISGLTGSDEDIARAAKAYRVYYRKVENKDYPDDYTMDHSTLIYLMDQDGDYIKHFPYGTTPEEISAELIKLIG